MVRSAASRLWTILLWAVVARDILQKLVLEQRVRTVAICFVFELVDSGYGGLQLVVNLLQLGPLLVDVLRGLFCIDNNFSIKFNQKVGLYLH